MSQDTNSAYFNGIVPHNSQASSVVGLRYASDVRLVHEPLPRARPSRRRVSHSRIQQSFEQRRFTRPVAPGNDREPFSHLNPQGCVGLVVLELEFFNQQMCLQGKPFTRQIRANFSNWPAGRKVILPSCLSAPAPPSSCPRSKTPPVLFLRG